MVAFKLLAGEGNKFVAFLSQIKSGGQQYIYLTEYCGNREFSSKKERHVYSFGNSRTALLKMKRWSRNFDQEFPEELKCLGCTKNDLEKWVMTLQTGITSTGRKFKVEMKKRAINKYINIY
jgi:hypothetical protein